MKRIVLAFICVMVLAINAVTPSLASGRNVHDDYMLHVLFGSNYKEENYTQKELTAIKALEAASYLAVDQYNGDGEEELKTLSDFKVPELPTTIDDIDFSGNQHHRRYTHRGWLGPYNNDDRPYPDDKAHWSIRKRVLVLTTKKVFALSDEQNRICDSLAAVIYYIHVLADHIVETDYTKMNSDLIGVGGRNDQYDIIHQLIIHFDILFASPNSNNRYNSFRAQLKLLNNEFSELVNSDGGINSPEKQAAYRLLAQKLMDMLIKHVPVLLKEEIYFSKIFPAR